MNFNEVENKVDLGNKEYVDMLTEEKVSGEVELKKYGILILKECI